jgi:hypothetical protein
MFLNTINILPIVIFIYANIAFHKQGLVYANWLLLFLFITFARSIIKINYFRINPKLSFIFISYITYIVIKVILEYDEPIRVLFNSGSGFLFYYITGFSISIYYSLLKNNIIRLNIKYFPYFTYFNLILSTIIFYLFINNLQEGIFVINDAGSYYQGITNYLCIIQIITSICSVISIYSKPDSRKLILIINFLLAINYVFISILAGSNKGPFIIIGIYSIFYLTTKRQLSRTNKISALIRGVILTKDEQNNNLPSKATHIIIVLTFFCSLLLLLNAFTSGIRMFVTNSSVNLLGSVISRLNIFGSFMDQFSIAPIFGNLHAHEMFQGGMYIHSMPIMALTHLGTVGFLLLIFSIIPGIYLRRPSKVRMPLFGPDNDINYLIFYIFIFILLFSVISGSIYAQLFWFVSGSFFPLITIRE